MKLILSILFVSVLVLPPSGRSGISREAFEITKAPGEIPVRRFGAVPGDGKDDSKAIQAAIDEARSKHIDRVTFEAGVYEFKGLPGWEGGGKKPTCYISLEHVSDLELYGSKDDNGKALTKWVKDNDLKEGQPTILSVVQGSNISIRNIEVDMAPYYYSAGKIVAVKDDMVTIEVLAGHPRVDGQKAYIMGLYDLAARKAKIVRLTWDFDLPQWHMAGDDKDRLMAISFSPLAKSCKVGDGVFWFQGNYTGALLRFENIQGIVLENVHILSGHGFPVTVDFCRDVTYRNVSIRPEGNRIATTCRDGFKIYCGGGKILMDNVHIEGCLGDDGQNVHGIWLSALRRQSERSLLTLADSMPCLTPGREVVLLDDKFLPAWHSNVEKCSLTGQGMLITFTDVIPEWVHERTPVEPQEWLPESLHITNSVYRSTGRFGVLLKSSNTLIEHCTFENNVAAIQIGGEWSWGYWLESTHSQNVEIRDCIFRDNHVDMRYGGQKMDLSINIASWTNPDKLGVPNEILSGLVRDVRIHDNLFENESLCVHLQNCGNVHFWNNTLKNCGKDLLINEKTATNIFRSAGN